MPNDANQSSASKTNESYNKVLESNEVKYCSNCGGKVLAKAVVCVHCGVSLEKLPQSNPYEWKPWSSMAMFWLVIGTLFLPFFGEIMGIWSLTVPGRRSQGLALLIFAIIKDLILLFLSIIFTTTIFTYFIEPFIYLFD